MVSYLVTSYLCWEASDLMLRPGEGEASGGGWGLGKRVGLRVGLRVQRPT